MAGIGVNSSFIFFDDHFLAGYIEKIAQNTNLFNGASNGAISLIAKELPSNFAHQTFFKQLSGLISHRDTASTAAVNDQALSMGDLISVKVNKRVGPVTQTYDSFRKLGEDPKTMSYYFGAAMADAVTADMLNTGLLSLDAFLSGIDALNHDITANTPGTITDSDIVETAFLLGDSQKDIVCYVAHSSQAKKLIQQRISDKIVGVADAMIYGGELTGLGKPLIVTDAPALAKTGPNFVMLGLTAGALEITESESPLVKIQDALGMANLAVRYQAEYAFNIGMKGVQWDVTHGGINPDDSTLGTASNWDQVATNIKHLPGVRLLTK